MVNGISGASSMWGQLSAGSMKSRKEQLFNKMDQNSDGSIDQTELQTVLDNISKKTGQSIDGKKLFDQYDSDGDGQLSESEAKSALASLFESLKPDLATMKKIFNEGSSYKAVDVTA